MPPLDPLETNDVKGFELPSEGAVDFETKGEFKTELHQQVPGSEPPAGNLKQVGDSTITPQSSKKVDGITSGFTEDEFTPQKAGTGGKLNRQPTPKNEPAKELESTPPSEQDAQASSTESSGAQPSPTLSIQPNPANKGEGFYAPQSVGRASDESGVTDQPINPYEIAGPNSVQPNQRVSANATGQNVDAPQIQGQKDLFARAKTLNLKNTKDTAGAASAAKGAADAAKSAKGAKDAATGDTTGAVLDNLKGKFGSGEFGQKMDKKIEQSKDAINVVRVFGGDFTALWPLIQKYWKPIMVISLLLMLPQMAIGFSIGQMLAGESGNSGGGIGTGSETFGAGSRCAEMATTKSVETSTGSGTGYTLTLSGTTGKFSKESEVNSEGHVLLWSKKNQAYYTGGRLAMWNSIDSSYKNSESLKWYITARWPYSAAKFNGSNSKKYFSGLVPSSAYVNQKVILFNPNNGKAVVGFVAEWGPAPYTGTFEKNDNGKYVAGDLFDAQKKTWNTTPTVKAGYRILDPAGFEGRVAGGGSAVQDALGTNNMSDIVYGFVSDEYANAHPDLKLGSFTCTVIQSETSTNGTTQPLNVPGIAETNAHECSLASLLSVAKYYNPSLTYTQTADDPDVCMTADYLNSIAKIKTNKFLRVTSSYASLEDAKRSVLAGDPVIIYTAKGSIYSTSKHIFVLAGWNESEQAFYVRNPWFINGKGGFDEITTTPNGKHMTIDYLNHYLGDSTYGHTFMIRESYTH